MIVNSNRFDFRDVIQKQLTRFGAETMEETYEAIDEVSKEAVKKLKSASPKGRTKLYARGWKRQIERGRTKVGATVYGGKNTYPLAHLLENGHKVGGYLKGKGKDRADPIVHIAPVEEWAVDEVQDRIIRKVEGIE